MLFHGLQIAASVVGVIYLVGYVRVLGPLSNRKSRIDLRGVFNFGFDVLLMQSSCHFLVALMNLIFHLVLVKG